TPERSIPMSTSRTALAASLAAMLSLTLAACAGDTADNARAANDASAPLATDPAVVDAQPPAPVAAPCNADAVQSLVGQASSDALVNQARTDSGAASVRALKPGDAATMDYR